MKKNILFILLFLFTSIVAFAHPHVWMKSSFDFVFREKQLRGVYISWTFDKFFSSDIIAAYDKNRDGNFNESETKEVFENAFISTKNYYYFTFIRVGKNRTSPKQVSLSDFSVRQKAGEMTYTFFVDLSAYKNEHEIFIACYDYTFFCDIAYPESCVKFSGNENSATYKIVENKNYPVYYDPFGAINDTRIYYEWKPGLNTYYPREIQLQF